MLQLTKGIAEGTRCNDATELRANTTYSNRNSAAGQIR